MGGAPSVSGCKAEAFSRALRQSSFSTANLIRAIRPFLRPADWKGTRRGKWSYLRRRTGDRCMTTTATAVAKRSAPSLAMRALRELQRSIPVGKQRVVSTGSKIEHHLRGNSRDKQQ